MVVVAPVAGGQRKLHVTLSYLLPTLKLQICTDHSLNNKTLKIKNNYGKLCHIEKILRISELKID